jgi:hypothetical protein
MNIVTHSSGVITPKECVNHVTTPVTNVLDLKSTDVLNVSKIDIYIKEDVNLNAQISSGLTIKPKLVNLVSIHVKNVSDQLMMNVILVTLVTSYSILLVLPIVVLKNGTT